MLKINEDIIELCSRYGEKNYLEPINENKYILKSDYIKHGTFADGSKYVDPSGGPIIVEEHKLLEANRVVKSIDFTKDKECIITFK